MRLDEKDRKFVKDWKEKREGKFQFILGIVLQVFYMVMLIIYQ